MSKPAISILAIMEPEGTNKLIRYQEKLGAANVSAHITLAIYYDVDEAKVVEHAKGLTEIHKAFNLSYYGVGVFARQCIIALPTISTQLMRLYVDVHAQYDEFCNAYTSAAENKWFPHTRMIYTDPDKAKELLPTAVDMFDNVDTKVVGLKVTRYIETDNGDEFTQLFTGYFRE